MVRTLCNVGSIVEANSSLARRSGSVSATWATRLRCHDLIPVVPCVGCGPAPRTTTRTGRRRGIRRIGTSAPLRRPPVPPCRGRIRPPGRWFAPRAPSWRRFRPQARDAGELCQAPLASGILHGNPFEIRAERLGEWGIEGRRSTGMWACSPGQRVSTPSTIRPPPPRHQHLTVAPSQPRVPTCRGGSAAALGQSCVVIRLPWRVVSTMPDTPAAPPPSQT